LIVKSIKIRVRAGDTDYTGFWFNPRVLEWFSAGRIEILRSRKITYSKDSHLTIDGEPQGVSLVVGEVYARFHAPARFDDLLQLQTKIVDVRDRTVKFEHVVKRLPDRTVLATGWSTSVCIDRKAMRAAKIPQRMVELLK